MSITRRLIVPNRGHPERSAGGKTGEAQSRDPVEGPMRWAASGAHPETYPGDFCVYILTNARRTVLYIGITNNLENRLSQHALGGSEFTRRFNATILVYYEPFPDALQAIAREKQLKRWSRAKKLALIGTQNPELRDLGTELFDMGNSNERRVVKEPRYLTNDTRSDNNPDLPRGPSTTRRLPPAPTQRFARDDRDGGCSV